MKNRNQVSRYRDWLEWYKPCLTIGGHVFFIILIIPSSVIHFVSCSTNVKLLPCLIEYTRHRQSPSVHKSYILVPRKTCNFSALSAHICSPGCCDKPSPEHVSPCREILRTHNVYAFVGIICVIRNHLQINWKVSN